MLIFWLLQRAAIHHNGNSILGEPVDWAMIPLQANAITCCVGVHTRIRT
ncbi:hypothetical protein ZJ38_002365 [Salmonella enterica subsp. enterica]|nr:hypothetical protein [Salmonella enterica subsp. enterica]